MGRNLAINPTDLIPEKMSKTESVKHHIITVTNGLKFFEFKMSKLDQVKGVKYSFL